MKHLLFVLTLVLGIMPAQQRERAGRGQQLPQAELRARLDAAQQRLQELQQRLEQRQAERGDEQRGRSPERRPEQRGDRRRGPAQGGGAMRQLRMPARPGLRAVMLHRLHQQHRLQLQPGQTRGFVRGRGAPARGEASRGERDHDQRHRGERQGRRPTPPPPRGRRGGDV